MFWGCVGRDGGGGGVELGLENGKRGGGWWVAGVREGWWWGVGWGWTWWFWLEEGGSLSSFTLELKLFFLGNLPLWFYRFTSLIGVELCPCIL